MTVAIMAYAIPEFANDRPIYDALLEQDRCKKRPDRLQQKPTALRSLR
jgi:hypothetical protein